MSGIEFFLLLIGFIFIAVSLFLTDGRKKGINNMEFVDPDSIYTEDDLKALIEKITEKIENVAAGHLLDVDDKLSDIANEKIIAVSDYTDQLFVKLENNHQEVIFLYNMLQEKEEEMKRTLSRMEVIRKENQAFIDKITEIRNQKMKAAMGNKKNEARQSNGKALDTAEKISGQNETDKIMLSRDGTEKDESDNRATDLYVNEEKPVTMNNIKTGNRNDKILKLYKDKKSLLEISKLLGIGQGEVKLVIDLYGKGSI